MENRKQRYFKFGISSYPKFDLIMAANLGANLPIICKELMNTVSTNLHFNKMTIYCWK